MLFRYPGGKGGRLARYLAAMQPNRWIEYREVFAGNAPLLWVLPPDRSRWVNDIDPDIHRYWTALRDHGLELMSRYYDLVAPFAQADIPTAQHEFEKLKHVFVMNDPVDSPAAHLILRRLAFKQLVQRSRPNICSFSAAMLKGHLIPRAKFQEAIERAKGLVVTNLDYREVLSVPPATSRPAWVFADPPYHIRCHGGIGIYEHAFSKNTQFVELRDAFAKCGSTFLFLMTLGNSQLTSSLFCQQGWPWHHEVRRYNSAMRNCTGDSHASELIIRNY
jgi:site-specific DNA-adenine methylase